MITSDDIVKADKTARFKGILAGDTAREVHRALAKECGIDEDVLEKFVNHAVLNVDRFMRLKNTEKDLIAVAIRHGFVVGCIATARQEREPV